ncbi:PP2C family protein-serine/threonine phosphatase [Neptuniibacter halophilus]|uniref:PP2C family protein-serine/threonine phosphatase n=1 Tax=Neptuniibacter halophilus TaxID=651666 RepID=UPI00257486E3|nr:SpoIIE family protein phosphatase [Neptuniibacter halophilus]
MRQIYQTILLIDQMAEAIDSVIDACDLADLPPVKISTAFSSRYALEMMQEHEFSLLIVGVGEHLDLEALKLLAAQQAPKPVLTLLPDEQGELVLQALRQGASDVFLRKSVSLEQTVFAQAISRLLNQADLIEKNVHYRDELEKSLGELQDDQQAARQIQQNMLPDNHVVLGRVQARYLLIPSLYLSGDFVDVVSIDKNKTLFYLADVSGHGASSALVTVLLKNMTNRLLRNFRRRSSFDILSPIDVLYRINSELLETELGKHLSIFIGLYDEQNGSLTYAVGGHHPMPVLRDQQGCRFLEGRGMPVGLFPEPLFQEQKLMLPAQFELTLFSDGILEVLPEEGMEAKEQRLIDAVAETKGGGPERIKHALLPGIISPAPDDIAIMTICRQ